MDITIKIELNGAKVEPTDQQKEKINKYVKELLLGKNETKEATAKTSNKRKKFKKILGNRRWTSRDIEDLLELAAGRQSLSKPVSRAIGRQLNRTDQAVAAKLNELRKNRRDESSPVGRLLEINRS